VNSYDIKINVSDSEPRFDYNCIVKKNLNSSKKIIFCKTSIEQTNKVHLV